MTTKKGYKPTRTYAILMPADYVRISCELIELSQAEIARRAGLKPSHLSEIIHGKRGIGVPVAKRLSKVLHVPVSKLIGAGDVDEARKKKLYIILERLRQRVRNSRSINEKTEKALLEDIDKAIETNRTYS